ncbi:uncharacterized protein ISCGN_005876 [Ixodes scapularis]
MSGSEGAVSAAQSGRGIRITDDKEYAVILPSLPTGSLVLNTVFLHADVKGRPYRAEEFRDALASLSLLPEVVALGAYQMNHVWAVTFKSLEGAKKLLATPELTVKGRRCIVVDPGNRDVRLKLHWLLFNVGDDDLRAALAPYGKVLDVSRERWHIDGCHSVNTMTRTAVLRLKGGVTPDDIPHQLRVAGELALVVVPGRAPLCLRCQRTGHIRKECRVPKCDVCRRFGHEGTQCVRTYAAAVVPVGGEEKSELLMNEADAEETIAGPDTRAAPSQRAAAAAPEGDTATSAVNVALGAETASQAKSPDVPSVEAPRPGVRAADTCGDALPEQPGDAPMETAVTPELATKRTRDVDGADPAAATKEEPPAKTVPLWRRRAPVRPNIPEEDRRAAKPPP